MSEWYENQKKSVSNFRKLLQERIEKANPRRELTAEEIKTKDLLGRDFKSTKNFIIKSEDIAERFLNQVVIYQPKK